MVVAVWIISSGIIEGFDNNFATICIPLSFGPKSLILYVRIKS